MKIFLTIELIGLIILILSEWRFWTHTHNWSSSDGGWTHTYTYSAKDRSIRVNLNYFSLTIIVAGVLFLIWA